MISAVKAASPAIGGAAIGAGIVMGAIFFNSTLQEIKDWWRDQWMADDETLEQNQNATTNTPAMSPEDTPFVVPPSLEGMSPAAIYSHVADVRGSLIRQQYDRWLGSFDPYKADNSENWNFFLGNSKGLLSNFRKVSTVLSGEQKISPFTYQMLIRETAARRTAGITGSAMTGWITMGTGFITGPVFWQIMNAINPQEWTSSDVREAPDFIYDPLLSLAWGRTDFSGTDAPVIFSVLDVAWAEYQSGFPIDEYESRLMSAWDDQQSDPSNLEEWWP